MPVLTNRQAAILAFMGRYFIATACWPSMREIMDEFGIRSPNGVMGHIHALHNKGAIEQVTESQSRGWRMTGVAGSSAITVVVNNRVMELSAVE